MKRSILYSLLTLAVVIGAVSCKKNNFVIDKDPLTVPAASEFAYYNANFAKNFYVQPSPTVNVFKVPVGITNVTNTDRTVQFTYTSTNATNGMQFTAPTSLTIKAGQALDSLPITGNYANLVTGTAYVVKIKISGGDVPAFQGKDSVMLTIRKYCPVVLTALAGNYNNTNEYTSAGAFSYGPYTTQLKNVTQLTATTASALVSNIYDDGWPDLTATLDWTDPANFKITIPLQSTGKIYSGTATTYVRTSTAAAAINTFSSCDRSISFGIDLVNSGTGALLTSNYKIVMK